MSQTTSEKSIARRGRSSYAAVASEPNTNNVRTYGDSINIETPEGSYGSISAVGSPQSISALEVPNKFPIEVIRRSPSPTIPQTFTAMPPYPPSPTQERSQPFDQICRHDQENLVPDPSANLYPIMSGPIPYETRKRSPSSPLRFERSNEYRNISNSLSSSFHEPFHTDILSLSTPDILHRQHRTYVPGHPELSHENSGYTSQPMSREPSGQSLNHMSEARRASIAETEPMPLLSDFSPKVQTSYQVYMNEEREREERPALKRSPPLRFAEPLEDITIKNNAHLKRRFNPMAPSFSPSTTTHSSPNMPNAPPNSTTTTTSLVSSIISSRQPSPLQAQLPFQPPTSIRQSPQQSPRQSPRQIQTPFSPPAPYPTDEQVQAPEMGRSSSGGVRIGPRTVIEFGTGVPGVVIEEARQRAERNRERIRREKAKSSGLGIQNLEN